VKKISIGIVDYGMGNHASVVHSLRDIGFRVRISDNTSDLDESDVLILPGVGAFPSAMAKLHERGLVDYLHQQANLGRPLIGICLGMQLLANASYEHKHTVGLGLIPGNILPFADHSGHIGWNTLEYSENSSLWSESHGEAFYFNHSFYYQGLTQYQVAISQHLIPFPSIIRDGNVVGLQFHPEKSQLAGKTLLKSLIKGLVNA
jgi:glutamine amidotransferase